MESVVRHSLDAISSKFLLLKGPSYAFWLQLQKETPLLACPSFHLYDLYSAVEQHVLPKTLQMESSTISLLSLIIGHSHLQHAGSGEEKYSCSRYHALFTPSHAASRQEFVLHVMRLFPFSSLQPFQPMKMNLQFRTTFFCDVVGIFHLSSDSHTTHV